MKKLPVILFFAYLFSSNIFFSQTITSVNTGGSWEDANTWLGGVVPGEGNDVIIAGTVSITSSNSRCRNLTINSGAILQNGGGLGWVTPTFYGKITNNGTIKNDGTGRELWMYTFGDIHNNGVWENQAISLSGQQTQTLSQSAGKSFNCEINRSAPSGKGSGEIITSSDITFNKYADFQLSGGGWGVLNLNGHNLILDGGMRIVNTTVTNVNTLEMKNGAYLEYISIDSDVHLKGICNINNSSVYFQKHTIIDGILQNSGGLGWVTPTFNGKITNNGIIRNDGTGRELQMYTFGDIHNNGIWENRSISLSGQQTQTLSQIAGKSFNCEINRSGPSGRGSGEIAASSDITFNKYCDFQLSGGGWGALNLNGYNLILDGGMRIANTAVTNLNTLEMKNGAFIEYISIDSDVHLKGICNINNSSVYFQKHTIIDGILQNSGGLGWVTPTFNGKITNNGTIRNDGTGRELQMYTFGDIHNNGIWENRSISLSGQQTQTLSQTAGKSFNCEIDRSGPSGRGSGTIVAGSDIEFNKAVNLQLPDNTWGIFNVSNYNITLRGSMRVVNTVFRNLKNLLMLDNAYLEYVSFETDVTLKGTCNLANSSVYFGGIVTVADTLQNYGGLGWVTGNFYNQIINNGVVRNNPAGREFWISITGSLSGNGIYKNERTYLYTGGLDRKVSGNYDTYFYLKKDGDPASGIIKFTETYKNKRLTQIEGGSQAEITNGCEFDNNSTLNGWGSISNKGTVFSSRNFSTNSNQSFYNLSVSIASNEGLDSMQVISYGDQVPSTFGNAAKSWWRINQYPNNVYPLFGNATFYYEDALLNNNDETQLKLFHSVDSGKTWMQLSTSANLTINANNNSVTITDIPAYGDYILSSEPNPYSVKPVIIVSVIGRSQMRIGPPNRYTINYANNSPVPTDDFLISILCGSNTRIMQAELPMADGTVEIFPADSLNMEYEDSVATFYVSALAANEEGSFDIVCTGKPLSKSIAPSIKLIDPFSIVAGAIIVYAGTKIIDYMGDKAVEKIDSWEVLTPAEKDAKRKIWGNEIKEEINKDKLRGVKLWTGRKVGQLILTKTMGVIKGAVDIADAVKTNVVKVSKSLRKKVWDWLYRESGLYGVETTESGTFSPEVTGTSKKMQGVTSWDPNEKNGPEGFGDEKFITSAGRMHYQILFENKKEASDAAYQIVILDTLSQVFDPSTVEFGATSHFGFTMTRQGNVLKWNVVGIELPPNVNPPEGEGYVTFSVKTADGLESGTAITNKATITFDLNKPITTNLYSNTLDFSAPLTNLNESIAVAEGDSLLLNWTADDTETGSGIGSTSLFCSIDDGAFLPAGISNQNSFKYAMTPGAHKYSFYALSTDNVGNSENTFTKVVSIDAVTSVEDIRVIPDEYRLMQNYPNPFNPSTTIQYWLPRDGFVELSIFNILGEKVIDLVKENQKAGKYYKSINLSALSSGVYLYRLEVNNFRETKKLMLIK